jgi:hypothetical protein
MLHLARQPRQEEHPVRASDPRIFPSFNGIARLPRFFKLCEENQRVQLTLRGFSGSLIILGLRNR